LWGAGSKVSDQNLQLCNALFCDEVEEAQATVEGAPKNNITRNISVEAEFPQWIAEDLRAA
jgi:hypothetical protein